MKTTRIAAFLAAATLTAAAAGAAAQTTSGDAAPTTPAVEVPEQPTRPDPEQAPEAQLVEKRLKFLLSGYEYFPTRADLDELASPEIVAGHLRSLATDEGARPTLRLRAVDALGFYDDAETVALLERLVARPTKMLEPKAQRIEGLVRHHAMTALARAQGARALEKLEPFLGADDLQLKLTAISALGKFGGEEGRQRLERLQHGAKDPVVLRELGKHLPR